MLCTHVADTGCCAREFGECQPQCRNRQHKLIEHRLILSSEYQTVVKTKNGVIATYKIKKWAETNYKIGEIEKKTKLNPVFKGLEKL